MPISPTDRIYLQPTAFVAQSQGDRVRDGLVWCSAYRVMWRDQDGAPRTGEQLVPFDGMTAFVAALPDGPRQRAERQLAAIHSPTTPLHIGGNTIPLTQPQVMGILNITPDSFSDGGQHIAPDIATNAALAMSEAGATIIDIGGESTRPGAALILEAEEIARVLPVIERLAHSGAALSIDTRKAAVMEAALAAGTGLINDITALLYDARSLGIVRDAGCPVVLMHVPSPRQDNPHEGPAYGDVLLDVFDWLEARIDAVVTAGVARDKIIVDPGIGFGKSLADNLALMNGLSLFHALGCPLLVGASRKRMIAALDNEAPAHARLGGSLALHLAAIEQGVQIIRAHDVPETVQAVRVWEALRGAVFSA